MKYLKLYEDSIIPKYKKDDYVLFNNTRIINDESFGDFKLNAYKNYGKIINDPFPDNSENKTQILYDIFYLSDITFTLTEIQTMYIPEEYIIRKLNDKELEEIEYLMSANKYNL